MKVGITGGIGSGKSFVCKIFETLDIPVYYADKEAKRLMIQDKQLKSDLKALLGKAAYHRNGRLNRAYVAGKIFKDKKLLEQVNQLVHPAVRRDYETWTLGQAARYTLEESAIIFENGLQKYFDAVILITADEALRIRRVMKRDKVSEEKVRARMNQQLPDHRKKQLTSFVIENNGDSSLIRQVHSIHKQLLKLKTKN